jgi:hypothetical protein
MLHKRSDGLGSPIHSGLLSHWALLHPRCMTELRISGFQRGTRTVAHNGLVQSVISRAGKQRVESRRHSASKADKLVLASQ